MCENGGLWCSTSPSSLSSQIKIGTDSVYHVNRVYHVDRAKQRIGFEPTSSCRYRRSRFWSSLLSETLDPLFPSGILHHVRNPRYKSCAGSETYVRNPALDPQAPSGTLRRWVHRHVLSERYTRPAAKTTHLPRIRIQMNIRHKFARGARVKPGNLRCKCAHAHDRVLSCAHVSERRSALTKEINTICTNSVKSTTVSRSATPPPAKKKRE